MASKKLLLTLLLVATQIGNWHTTEAQTIDVTGEILQDTECGLTKGCYSDCTLTCTYQIKWKDVGDNVEFMLQQKIGADTTHWIGLGLSSDQLMGDDSVIECVMTDAASGTVEVYLSYNSPLKYNVRLEDATGALTAHSGVYANGILSCEFTRRKVVEDEQIFNLNNDYYLLFATGTAVSGNKDRHLLNPLPKVSHQMADFQTVGTLYSLANFPLVKAHAVLMIIAWVFSASIGIIIARFYKPMWPDSSMCGDRPWFQIHRALMCLTLFSVCAGFILIFVQIKDWSQITGNNFQKAHPYLGVITTFLTITNPVMAAFRCHPADDNRPIYNWAHWAVGTVAHILAILTIILGITLPKAGVPFWVVYVVIAFAIYEMVMEFILEVYECVNRRKAKRQSMERHHRSNKYQQQNSENPPGSKFKKIFLGVHVTLITLFTVVIVFLVVAPISSWMDIA